jgi:hypothetical protein
MSTTSTSSCSSIEKPNKRVFAYDYRTNRSNRSTSSEVQQMADRGTSERSAEVNSNLSLSSTESAKLTFKKIKPGQCSIDVSGRDLISNSKGNDIFQMPSNFLLARVHIPWDIWMGRFLGQYHELYVLYPNSLIHSGHHDGENDMR